MSTYIITNCTVDDAPEVARHSMNAFWQDPNWRMLWRQTTLPFVVEQATARAPRGLLLQHGATARHYKAVDAETGRFLGYIRWKLPAGRCGQQQQQERHEEGGVAVVTVLWADGQTPDVPGGEEERAALVSRAEAAWWVTDPSSDVLDGPIMRKRDDLMARKEYIVLDYLAVHPEEQGRGVGTALVRHGIAKARELGVDIFVTAFVGGFGLYERLGFTLLDAIVQDATPYGGNDNYAVRFLEMETSKQRD